MPNDEMKDDLRTQWQSQPPEGGTDVSRRGSRAGSTVPEKNTEAEYSRVFRNGSCHWDGDTSRVFLRSFPLIVVAMGLIIAGTLVIAYQFRKRMSTRSFTAAAASMSCLEFYRRELERQRDANLSIWSWYILPMLPGTAMMLIGMAFMPALGPVVALFYAVAFTAAFIFTGVANKRAARRLQQKIDELRS